MKTLFLFIALLFGGGLSAQTDSLDASNDPRLKTANGSAVLNADPQFPGGVEAFRKFLNQHMQYPKQAMEEGQSGRVYVKFTVDEKGNIRDIVLLKRAGHGFDEEALRLFNMMPKWLPAIQNGKYSKAYLNYPIDFKMR